MSNNPFDTSDPLPDDDEFCKGFRIDVPPGTAFILNNKCCNEGGLDAFYMIEGDLNTWGIIAQALEEAGFELNWDSGGLQPGFSESRKDEYLRALEYIWSNKLEGWWNQPLTRNGICTRDEHNRAIEITK
jgi:hypothetical protein